MAGKYRRFADFYPFYLSEHQNRTCRRLHAVGSTSALILLSTAFVLRAWWPLLAAVMVGYGFAWIGHSFFEKNRPATFRHPFYSFIGDWAMLKDMITGRIRF